MAALTWRNVDAPQLDTRPMALAGASITNSFDRMAEMLFKREASLRTEATNAALAGGMANQDPEAVKALLAQGTGGLDKRVDALAYMQGLGQHQNQLVERSMNQEQLEALQDPEKFGVMYAQLEQAAKQAELTGDFKARDELVAQMQGARNIAAHLRGGVEMGNKDQDQKLQVDEFGETKWKNRQEVAAEQQRIAISASAERRAAAESAFRMRAAQEERTLTLQERADKAAGEQYGDRYAAAPGILEQDPGDALIRLRRQKNYNALSDTAKKAAEERITARLGVGQAMTEEDKAASGGPQSSIPLYLRKDGGQVAPSANSLEASINGLKSQSKVAQAAVTNSFLADNPDLDVFKRVSSMAASKKAYTFDEVVQRYADESGIMDPADTLKTVQQRYNLSNNEMVALLESSGFKDGGLLSPASYWTDPEKDPFTGGTALLGRRAKEYAAARTSGDITKTEEELGGKLGSFAALEASLDKVTAKLNRQRMAGASTTQSQAELNRLKNKLREMATQGSKAK